MDFEVRSWLNGIRVGRGDPVGPILIIQLRGY